MFIAACISITVGLVLYLFYWNRFIAFIIGLFIRLVWWKSSDSSVWVEIGISLVLWQFVQFSPYFRVHPFLTHGGSNTFQGPAIPFQQPDLQSRQRPVYLGLLDQKPNHTTRRLWVTYRWKGRYAVPFFFPFLLLTSVAPDSVFLREIRRKYPQVSRAALFRRC